MLLQFDGENVIERLMQAKYMYRFRQGVCGSCSGMSLLCFETPRMGPFLVYSMYFSGIIFHNSFASVDLKIYIAIDIGYLAV